MDIGRAFGDWKMSVRSNTGTLASTVYDRIRQDIISATLAPGMKLNIERLCDKYAVGGSPVREALNRLTSEGLVTQRDQRGFMVLPVSLEELKDLIRTSCLINGLALREALANAGKEWEESVILAFHYLARTPITFPEAPMVFNPEWEVRHRAFHVALIAGCRSQWLMRFSEILLDLTYRYRHLYLASGGSVQGVAHDHSDLLDAALARNAEALDSHFTKFSGEFEDHLIRSGVLGPIDGKTA
jgi:DNA-binding GntR family transcriptional regulator